MLVHVQRHLHVPNIGKAIEEQLNREVQVIEGSRKRQPVDESLLLNHAEYDSKHGANPGLAGTNSRGPSHAEGTVYRGESASLRSFLMKTGEHIGEDYWLSPEPYRLSVGLFVIKPDLVASGISEEIIDQLRTNGFVIHAKIDKLLAEEEMIKLFKPDIDDLNLFHRFMTSGPSTYAIVSKGHTGRSTSDALHDLIGPAHPDIANQENLQCLTAVYGTDEVLNGFYSSSSNQEALTEIQMIFPVYQPPIVEGNSLEQHGQKEAILCLLGPAQVRAKRVAILRAITDAGFEIRYEKIDTFRPDDVESLYVKHRNQDYFPALVEAYTAGPCLLLYLAKAHCLDDFSRFLGPFARADFSKKPGTLRHDFDESIVPVTTIHGSETMADAKRELEQFFPFQQTLALIKPGLTATQKDEILKRLHDNGFNIAIRETKVFNPEVLTQFYARHRGLPWFNAFIQFMTSDTCEVVVLAREDAVQALRKIMGPVDPVRAKTDAPDSIRAIYGLDIMRNGLHASSSKKHAQEEIRLLFPDYELAPSPSADPMPADEVEHNDLARINPLFHHVFDSYHLEGDEIIFEVSVDTQLNENETTDSAVFITVIGSEDETRPFLLRYSSNTVDTLQSHQIDRFHFIDFDVGIAKAIRFSHDGRGFPKNWTVAYVEVAASNRKKLSRIDINEVIDDDKIKTEYPVTDNRTIEGSARGNCAIIIQTGSAKYAGTSGDCSILLSGPQGVYAFQLGQSLTNRIAFQSRSRDIFLVQVDEQLKHIEYMVLEHSNDNSSPAWFVDFVRVQLSSNNQEYFFPVNRWISKDYLDGKTKITLSANSEKPLSYTNLLETRSTVLRYEIYIVTGSMPEAATSRPVWLTIYGTRGSIINKYLEIAENQLFPFEPDNSDLFVLYDLDIGEVDKLILAHESVDADQGWFVQSIAIHVPSKQYQSEVFKIHKWLNSKRPDGVPLVEIQVRKPTIRVKRNLKQQRSRLAQPISTTTIRSIHEPEFPYTVHILTEDFHTDLSQPAIFIDLIDQETMATNYMRLKNASSDGQPPNTSLQNNVLGKFKAHGTRIDQINTIRLLIRSPDQVTRWLPSFILIQIDHNQQLYEFENSSWLDYSGKDDYQTITSSSVATPASRSNDQVRTSSDILINANQRLERQLHEIKQRYTAKTGEKVIDHEEVLS